jgi:hypothetical protein
MARQTKRKCIVYFAISIANERGTSIDTKLAGMAVVYDHQSTPYYKKITVKID